jgi:FkbH-like protein
MRLAIRPMAADDIPRVLELMSRTHQLNTTGLAWDRSALEDAFPGRPEGVRVMVAELRDRFGWYGIIGTAILVTTQTAWRLKYLAVSCRVMGRGIERALLSVLVRAALDGGCASPEAEFRDTGRNRMMRALYQMMGFTAGGQTDNAGTLIFRARPGWLPDIPRWVEVV